MDLRPGTLLVTPTTVDGDALFAMRFTVNPLVEDGSTIFNTVQASSDTFDI